MGTSAAAQISQIQTATRNLHHLGGFSRRAFLERKQLSSDALTSSNLDWSTIVQHNSHAES